MAKNLDQFARELSTELKEKGYGARLDKSHPHPRLYVSSGPVEQFLIMSSTANYDEPRYADNTRKDLKQNVLTRLPVPELKANGPHDPNAPLVDAPIAPSRVHQVKIFVRRGALGFSLPTGAIPKDKPHAMPQLFGDKFGVVFSAKDGALPSKLSTSDTSKCYWFGAKTFPAPFKHAKQTPPGWKTPAICARAKGDTLVCDDPIPPQILDTTTEAVHATRVKEAIKAKDEAYTLQDGAGIKEMFNDWLDWARNKGHAPEVTIDERGHVRVAIVTKVVQEL